MTVTYGFYDSVGGDRKYNAEQMARMFDGLIDEGVFATFGSGLVITASSPASMIIHVADGRAWLDHTWTWNDSDLPLTVVASEPVLSRIDTVVIEVNRTTRINSIKIIKGTPASSPVPPTMSNTSTIKQYRLANISVAPVVTQITQANITNFIGVAGGTPFITGLVDSIDASTLLGQFQSDFDAWLQNLQDQLDDNQAGNLQVQIDNILSAQKTGWRELTETFTYASAGSIAVASDATLRFYKGWGIRFKQGGAYKYMYITAVAPTLLTVFGGQSYTVANAAITDVAVTPNPQNAFGFPSGFNFANPPIVGFSSLPSTIDGRFWLNGLMCTYVHFQNGAGNSNSTLFTVGLPIAMNADGNTVRYYGQVFAAVNNSASILAGASVLIAHTSPTVAQLFTDSVSAGWSSTGTKMARFQISYPI